MIEKQLENQLNSFDDSVRAEALCELKEKDSGIKQFSENVNMHFHSFFSYNSKDWSPSRIAWESAKAGLYAASVCDFDVLDGQNEFLNAGEFLGLRTAVHLETRAFLTEYADKEINSPGEPGVAYVMGAGFALDLEEDSTQKQTLTFYRQKAKQRNKDLINRINHHIGDIAIDYEMEVLPLTPSGSATERHIIRAYINKSRSRFTQTNDLSSFWSKILEQPTEKISELLNDAPALANLVRAKLAKQGGVGYVQPSEDTFPKVDDFIDWVLLCQAIPMTTWLDGTSNGETDGRAMLECMTSKGAAALNIIPDRNWNITDLEIKKTKQLNLQKIIETANEMQIPINIGTEMNNLGLPFVDDLTCQALKPYKDIFVKGAQIMVGHSLLLRYAGFSYTDEKAQSLFDHNTKAKNDFFASVGSLEPLTTEIAKKLQDAGKAKAFDTIYDASKKGSWSNMTPAS